MRAAPCTTATHAIDLVDGLHGVLDVAFTHDLAVSFADLGTHRDAMVLADCIDRHLLAIADELAEGISEGVLGALFETLRPVTDALFELLFESACQLNNRALVSVLGTRRPLEVAFGHLRCAARLGANARLGVAMRQVVVRAVESLIADIRAFEELLRVLDPAEAPEEACAPAPE